MGKIIGIDLGTTTSEIAFMENDQPKIITDCFGNRIVPSVVGKKEDGTVVVGQVAYNQLISSPDRNWLIIYNSYKRYVNSCAKLC